jgi:uncharacterized LabA/DUF88 family protein
MQPRQKNRNDMTSVLAKSLKNQRVSVFVDAANLYHASTQAGIRIDFVQIAKWFKENVSKTIDLRFYTAYDPENTKQIQFLDELVQIGYIVIKKPIKDFGTFIKGNMDIELAVDAISNKDNFDILVLISGDGDFTYLINSLEKSYKKTMILSVGGFTSYELHLVADSYFFMNRIAKIWQTPRNADSKFIVSTDDFQNAYIGPEANKGSDYESKIQDHNISQITSAPVTKKHGVILKIDED